MGPRQFKFLVQNGSGPQVVARDWSTTTTYTWTPTAPGNYIVTVWARSAGVTADAAQASAQMAYAINGPLTIAGITSDLPSPQTPGRAITFTASATGSTGSYQFKWWLFNGTTWTMIRDWGAATYTWTPNLSNASYRIGVWARDGSTTADVGTFNLSVPYVINPSGSLSLNITSDVPNPRPVGTTITFTASATGGTGSYQFKWWVFDGTTWTTVQNWGGATFTWTPTQPGANYWIGIWARDSSTTADVGQYNRSIPFVVSAPGSLGLGLTSNVSLPQPAGTSITFTPVASGGSGSYQFKWWVFNGVTWTMVRDWSTGPFTWTPTLANANYRVGIWGRDATSTADSGQFNLSIATPITP